MQVIAQQEPSVAVVQKGQWVTLRCPKIERRFGAPYGDDCWLPEQQSAAPATSLTAGQQAQKPNTIAPKPPDKPRFSVSPQ